MIKHSTFPALLQAFFTKRLIGERDVSSHTIASYRDTFRLLISFAEQVLKKAPSNLTIEDLDASFILRFLDSLEKARGNNPRTRNCRLAAIHSFFNYVALHEPAFGGVAQRVLAIQGKRCTKRPVPYLTKPEMEALLEAPDQRIWSGQRDRTILLLALETGLRVSELVGLSWQDVVLGTGAHVKCTGKGRKTRCIPLRKETGSVMNRWRKIQSEHLHDPVFPNARGQQLSRDGVQYLLTQHVKSAREKCQSLINKRITPHVLRHSTAMNMLQNGVDCSVIALWLGHESMETTQAYLHASVELKERALSKTKPFKGKPLRYRPPDQLKAFLLSL